MSGRITFWLTLLAMVYGGYIHGPYISEFHYDNTGAGAGEFVEVFFPDPQPNNPSEYKIYLYNGSDSMVYESRGLQGILAGCDTEKGGCYYIWERMSSFIQDGPDGIALVHETTEDTIVYDFISYEGTIKALDGPVLGLTSSDVGFWEDNNTPVGWSLQKRTDGTWFAGPETKGSVNPIVLLSFEGEYIETEKAVWLKWKTASELNNKYFEVQRSIDQWTYQTLAKLPGAGHSFSALSYDYLDDDINLDAEYYYRVKQTDFDGRHSFTPVIQVEVKGISKAVQEIRPFVVHNTLQFSGRNKHTFHLSLYSSLGQLLWHQPVVRHHDVFPLNIPTHSPVFYVIQSGRYQWSGQLCVIQ